MFDASDPGTGKTRVAIEVIRARALSDGRAALVIAPKSLLRSVWRNEIIRFAPEMTSSVAYAENREEAFARHAEVYITNHDAVNWIKEQDKKFFKRFSTLIVDESGAYRHHTSKRSRAIRSFAPLFEFKENMNGTVNPNTILDAWHQYYLLDEGRRLGRSFFGFRNAVCRPVQVGPMPNMVRWEDKEGAEASVAALVRDITIRHLFEDCVDIPENHEYSVTFRLGEKAQEVYQQMKREALAQLETGTVEAVNAAVVATKLLQIASGAVYQDEFTYHVVDEARNELIMDMLEERKHSLVFFNWKHQKDQLIAAAKRRGYTYTVLDGDASDNEKEEAVRLFEAGFYKIMFAHPQSAAHGLTLVRAATTIWASPTYNLEHFVQGNRRIYRTGQTQKTETIVVIAEATIDEKAYLALASKKVRMFNLLEELTDGSKRQ
jgi:SNF2 family DNA or RNA helicase